MTDPTGRNDVATTSWEADIRRRLTTSTGPSAPAPAGSDPPATSTPDAAGSTISRADSAWTAEVPEHPSPHRPVSHRRDLGRRARALRWIHRVGAALSADALPTELAEAAYLIQQPVSTGRRVAFVGAGETAGTTTTMSCVAQVLARLRDDGVAVLGAADEGRSLSRLLGTADASQGTTVGSALTASASGDALVRATDTTRFDGLRAVDDPDADPAATAACADRLGRRFAFTLTDAGTAATHPALRLAHAVVLVVPPGDARAAMRAYRALDDAGVPRARLLTVVAGVRRATASQRRRAGWLLAPQHHLVRVLPHEEHLALDGRLAPDRWHENTTAEVWRVTADLVRLSRDGR